MVINYTEEIYCHSFMAVRNSTDMTLPRVVKLPIIFERKPVNRNVDAARETQVEHSSKRAITGGVQDVLINAKKDTDYKLIMWGKIQKCQNW